MVTNEDDFGDEIICEESGTPEVWSMCLLSTISFLLSHWCSCLQEIEFDLTVGALEEIVLDEKFVDMQNEFCLQNCGILIS